MVVCTLWASRDTSRDDPTGTSLSVSVQGSYTTGLIGNQKSLALLALLRALLTPFPGLARLIPDSRPSQLPLRPGIDDHGASQFVMKSLPLVVHEDPEKTE
jgi:hypothetical protein